MKLTAASFPASCFCVHVPQFCRQSVNHTLFLPAAHSVSQKRSRVVLSPLPANSEVLNHRHTQTDWYDTRVRSLRLIRDSGRHQCMCVCVCLVTPDSPLFPWEQISVCHCIDCRPCEGKGEAGNMGSKKKEANGLQPRFTRHSLRLSMPYVSIRLSVVWSIRDAGACMFCRLHVCVPSS